MRDRRLNAIRNSIDLVQFMSVDILLEECTADHFIGGCIFSKRFHDLSVNRARQSWKCDACQIGGDIFSYVMARDKVELRGAIAILESFLTT